MSESPESGEEKKPEANDVEFADAEVAKTDDPSKSADPDPPKSAEPDPLELAKAEAAKFREQLLRTAADFDNFRKRSRREVDDATRKGKEQALKELLPVFDNLERATASAESAPDVKSVADGLKMVGRQFTTTLEKLGIKRIQSVGQPFDPSQHEAIQHVESSEHAPGVITAEVQAGYLIGEHLLRAAMVVVSKGAPEAAPAEDAESN